MMNSRIKKNNSNNNLLFFFTITGITILFLITFITIKNDCILLRNEIHHLDQIKNNQLHKVKILSANVKKYSSQHNVEKIANEKFGYFSPTPESLVVIIE